MRAQQPDSRAIRLLTRWMLCVTLAVVAIGAVFSAARYAAGEDVVRALSSTTVLQARHLRLPVGLDSWLAMAAASIRTNRFPDGHTYGDSLELDNCKFQYPPVALLLFEAMPLPELPIRQIICSRDAEDWTRMDADNWPIKRWVNGFSRLAVAGTLLVTFLLMVRMATGTLSRDLLTQRSALGLLAATTAAGLLFYPIISSYELGQIQVFLNFLVAAALLAALQGQLFTAGLLIGLCCVFKPQYAVLLLWALFRRERRFGAALGGMLLLSTALGVLWYGWAMHIEYFQFLRGLSRHGEVFWANQSVNGLLNRWFETAPAAEWADGGFAASIPESLPRQEPFFPWDAAGFPPYHPVVYIGTLLSSLLLMVLAYLPPGAAKSTATAMHAERKSLDLATLVVACTLASPIAWQHHFGCFFAVLGLALGYGLRRRPATTWRDPMFVVLALSYVLMAFAFLRPGIVFASPARGVLGSHLWLGAVMLFGALLVLRRTGTAPAQLSPSLCATTE